MTKCILVILTFYVLKSSGQTTIDERKFSMSVKNENICYSTFYDFSIPYLVATMQNDVRSKINDSLSKIARDIIDMGAGFDFDYYDVPCDSSKIKFDPEEFSIEYRIWQNSQRLLSINITSGWRAGGGGSGFSSTDYFFTVDHFNNEIITIDSLFTSKNKIALQRFVNKNLGRLVKEQGYTGLISDSLNIFGAADEDFGFSFVGFNIDSTSLILTYSRDLGRGNYSFPFKLPLKEIHPYFNKKYLWLYSRSDKK